MDVGAKQSRTHQQHRTTYRIRQLTESFREELRKRRNWLKVPSVKGLPPSKLFIHSYLFMFNGALGLRYALHRKQVRYYKVCKVDNWFRPKTLES